LYDYLSCSSLWHQRRVGGGTTRFGEILASYVRRIDTLARAISYAGAAVPAATLEEVRGKLAALIGF